MLGTKDKPTKKNIKTQIKFNCFFITYSILA